MKVTSFDIAGPLLIEVDVFKDDRGFFLESFNKKKFFEITKMNYDFVQDNHSASSKNVLRGLHYQVSPNEQGKLVRCLVGEVYDVAVDIRRGSPTFGKYIGVVLSDKNMNQFWIPPGFAHGFLVLSDKAEFAYKTTNYYSKVDERSIRWDDPSINIKWPITEEPILSVKDKTSPFLDDLPY
ncbi:dTDP-4-dehydrorhamnose 3,5-epimerase [Kluyvera genomosp. 1]|uniref:dTDP-4-dehydrorhamnose 3,5-epimerase n=1 Tax=Kluyvera genomosp. 1 TaxID=2774053 RepID=UPI00069030EA|nr:dTDP-4-dehydrorhamnose 3,5-epimerase [Kluyvera genomosp. 1]